MISTAALVTAALFLAVHLASVFLALVHLGRRADGRVITGLPRITLMRPVCGRDAFDAETLGSSFRQDWPAYDIIFCAPSDNDAAVPLVRDLIAAHRQVPARLLTGQAPITGNPKLDNLWKGWDATDADWVCMADSNLDLPHDYLTTLVRTWQADTGLVTSPACGQRPEGFAGRLECAFLNSNQGRLQLASDMLGQGFAQGKTLFWNRDFLNAQGGLAPLGRWLAEDVASTKIVRAAGKRVQLAPRLFAQPIGRRTLRQVWDRQLRWSRVRRDGFPRPFLAEILNGAAVPVLLALIGGGWLAALGLLVLWFASEWLLCRRAGWPSGPADVVAMVLRDAMMPLIYAVTFASREITWRGTAMASPADNGTRS